MASASSTTKLLLLRRLSRAAFSPSSSVRFLTSSPSRPLYLLEAPDRSSHVHSPLSYYYPSRNFFSSSSSFSPHLNIDEELSQGPAPIDYSSVLQEDEFHRLANSTIQELLEKIEEYGDTVDIDGFDIDYGNQVLTVKFGSLGTYVLNKQTPNRQIWMSSPMSGPSRFDWDQNAKAWIYRRNKSNLSKLLEDELEKLCGRAINLS